MSKKTNFKNNKLSDIPAFDKYSSRLSFVEAEEDKQYSESFRNSKKQISVQLQLSEIDHLEVGRIINETFYSDDLSQSEGARVFKVNPRIKSGSSGGLLPKELKEIAEFLDNE